MNKERTRNRIKGYIKDLIRPTNLVALIGILVPFIILIATIKSNHKENIALAKHSQYLSWLNEFTNVSAEFVDVEINEAGELLGQLSELTYVFNSLYDEHDNEWDFFKSYLKKTTDLLEKVKSTYTKFYFYMPLKANCDEKELRFDDEITLYHQQLTAILTDINQSLYYYCNEGSASTLLMGRTGDTLMIIALGHVVYRKSGDTDADNDGKQKDSIPGIKRVKEYIFDDYEHWLYDDYTFCELLEALASQIDNTTITETMREYVEYEKNKIQEPLTNTNE